MTIQRDTSISLLFTSDIHGFRCPINQSNTLTHFPRFAALSHYIAKQKKKHGGNVIWIDNGDTFQGSPLSDYFMKNVDHQTPHPMSLWHREIGCDLFVPGNHEFNYGLATLNRIKEQSSCPWLSANIVNDQTREPCFGKPYRIWTTDSGVRVGVLGLTTAYIPHWEQPEHIKNMSFLSAVAAAKRWIPLIRNEEQADLVVVAYHGGFERDLGTGELAEPSTGENEGYALCAEELGIDVLLTGHQHREIEGARIGNTLVLQPGVYGSHIGEITVRLGGDNDKSGKADKWRIQSIQTQLVPIEPDESTAPLSWTASYEQQISTWMEQTISRANGSMRICNAHEARLRKHPFIQWLNQAQMYLTGAELSLTSLMSNDSPGFDSVIRNRDIAANYPYANTLTVLKVSGERIRSALERSASYFLLNEAGNIEVSPEFFFPKAAPYNYDMWEGISYTLDLSQPVGQRVVKLDYQDAPLNMDASYTVVMNHYRAGGGGGYDMFRDCPVMSFGTREAAELLSEYAASRAVWDVDLHENWKILQAAAPENQKA